MRAGRLRHKITIQQLTGTRDSFGAVNDEWQTFYADIRAGIETLGGRELFAAQQVAAEVSTKIRIRHHSGVAPQMRVVSGADVYDILAIVPDFKRRETSLLCKQVNP